MALLVYQDDKEINEALAVLTTDIEIVANVKPGLYTLTVYDTTTGNGELLLIYPNLTGPIDVVIANNNFNPGSNIETELYQQARVITTEETNTKDLARLVAEGILQFITMTKFKFMEDLSTQEQKYCSCVLKVAAKDTAGKYNPYAVCAASTGTTSRRCGNNYDYRHLSYDLLLAYAKLIGAQPANDREQLLVNINNRKREKYGGY